MVAVCMGKYLSGGSWNQSNAPASECDNRFAPLHYHRKGEGQFFRRQNGAIVAFSEYGDPNGTPVFFCHGWPSSRTMAELTNAAARDLGVRIISPDRPGISRSAFQANRKLVDWPPVLQQLADHLEIERFHMLAISGG